MTKEEIAYQLFERWDMCDCGNRDVKIEHIEDALAEYAKQSTIDFLKWRDSQPGNPQDGSVWWWGVSEDQQYEMFIESQKQQSHD